MKCLKCGYIGNCPCEFKGELCSSCYINPENKHIMKSNNNCNQTIENLENIKKYLQNKERTNLISTQISIINSQINMFEDNPCKFKQIIDNISLN